MKQYKLLISKDKIKRKFFLKNEIKKLILKSIFKNHQTNELNRIDALKHMTFFSNKSRISKQNNMCLLSGRNGGVFKNWQISRHNIKQLGKFNMLHNTKINSW
jgi:ribosomal protein S14